MYSVFSIPTRPLRCTLYLYNAQEILVHLHDKCSQSEDVVHFEAFVSAVICINGLCRNLAEFRSDVSGAPAWERWRHWLEDSDNRLPRTAQIKRIYREGYYQSLYMEEVMPPVGQDLPSRRQQWELAPIRLLREARD